MKNLASFMIHHRCTLNSDLYYFLLQGDMVRSLKENKGSDNDLARAVAELKHRKKLLEDKV